LLQLSIPNLYHPSYMPNPSQLSVITVLIPETCANTLSLLLQIHCTGFDAQQGHKIFLFYHHNCVHITSFLLQVLAFLRSCCSGITTGCHMWR